MPRAPSLLRRAIGRLTRLAGGTAPLPATTATPAAPATRPADMARKGSRTRGYCPACETPTVFVATTGNPRGGLLCQSCRSVPRDRAAAALLAELRDDWRSLDILDIAPAARGLSAHMAAVAPGYVGSHFDPSLAPGAMRNGTRNENLQALSFPDQSLDVIVHLDVLEHVDDPAACLREIARVLRPGGVSVFTTPVYADKPETERRARLTPDGPQHLAPPEYHGNPSNDGGSLVTFHFGTDLPDLMRGWVPGVEVLHRRAPDLRQGIIGPFLDVFALRKPAQGAVGT